MYLDSNSKFCLIKRIKRRSGAGSIFWSNLETEAQKQGGTHEGPLQTYRIIQANATLE